MDAQRRASAAISPYRGQRAQRKASIGLDLSVNGAYVDPAFINFLRSVVDCPEWLVQIARIYGQPTVHQEPAGASHVAAP